MQAITIATCLLIPVQTLIAFSGKMLIVFVGRGHETAPFPARKDAERFLPVVYPAARTTSPGVTLSLISAPVGRVRATMEYSPGGMSMGRSATTFWSATEM